MSKKVKFFVRIFLALFVSLKPINQSKLIKKSRLYKEFPFKLMKINPSLINQKDTKHRKVCKQKAKKFLKKLFLVRRLEKKFASKN
jgi:hypothetical protein